ncbi:MAG: RNA 2',3'-cyclic phosphodiesterase [Phycisphaerae bacterium]|nr:RNA 2',3'-cyclic phosphodiesterase [Phycisphaerae bacterium]
MRSFIAIELDEAIRRVLAALVAHKPPRGGVRWCTAQQLHVTLKFLDQIPDATIPRIIEVMATAASGIEPFPIRIGGLGGFPSPQQPRVLWVGVDDPTRGCARWLSAADSALVELGIPSERRAFTPHITLARSRDASGVRLLASVLGSQSACPSSAKTVERLTLFESVLSPGGVHYRSVATVPLATG